MGNRWGHRAGPAGEPLSIRSAALVSITSALVLFVFLLLVSRGGQKLQLIQLSPCGGCSYVGPW